MRFALKFVLILVFLLITTISFSQDMENIKYQDPFSIRGNIGVEFSVYNAWNKTSSYDPFTYQFQGNPTLSIYGFDLPFSFVVGNRGNRFSQPFNTFGVSPKYKWITMHAGFRSLNFSKYSLGGQLILGGGIELNPGRFRFGLMGGRFQKAVEVDSSANNYPAFKRVGFAFKVGYGTDKNYVDVVLMKAVDRIGSLDSIPDNLNPSENLVFAVKTYQKIPKGFYLEGEWAHSLYAKDIRLAEQEVNNALSTVLPFLITGRANVVGKNAIEAKFGYEMDYFSLAAQFKRVDNDFESMGAYFFQDDVMNITVDPTVYLMKRKLVIGGTLGFEWDNLEENKTATTKRLIGGANVNLSLDKYIMSLSFINYGITQRDLIGQQDSINQIDQVNRDVNTNHTLIFSNDKLNHVVSFYGQYQEANDRNDMDFTNGSYTNLGGGGQYQFSLLKSSTTISAGGNANQFKQDTITNLVYGPDYGIAQRLLKNQLILNFNHSIQFNRFLDANQSVSHQIRFSAGYRIKKQHQVTIRTNLHRVNALDTNGTNFTEFKGTIGYEYKFNYTKKKK